jgi:hypothetical protein
MLWDKNGGNPGYSDKDLARIQFAAALVDALESGLAKERQALLQAAGLVAAGQKKDGSWQIDADGTVGSPATYGPFLATYQARQILQSADAPRYQTAIAQTDEWFRTVPVKTVMAAAVVMLALEEMKGSDLRARREECLALIRKGQSEQGGWGPYVNSAPEAFDTAIVLLALVRRAEQADIRRMTQRGRSYLLATQKRDGSWPETTRPAGAESYAQRLSTTGWATLALLRTRQLASTNPEPR